MKYKLNFLECILHFVRIKTVSKTQFKVYTQLKKSYQLLSENKLHSLNSTYNFCALKNLQFRFHEKNLNLNQDSNLGSPDH